MASPDAFSAGSAAAGAAGVVRVAAAACGIAAPLAFAPWRLSGVVYGTLMNDPAALEALGAAVHEPPYRAPPRAPVLYLKPRNTLACDGDPLVVPAGHDAIEVGVSLGIVIGRTACRVPVDVALDADAGFVAGFVLVADVSVPHASWYRPSVRWRARDGYCPVGAAVPREALPEPDAYRAWCRVDGHDVGLRRPAARVRGCARLLADVTGFMTLQPGDVLTLGVDHGAARVAAGRHVEVGIDGIGALHHPVVGDAA